MNSLYVNTYYINFFGKEIIIRSLSCLTPTQIKEYYCTNL